MLVSAALSVPRLTIGDSNNGGTLSGAGTLTVTGNLVCDSGRMVGPGMTEIAAGATATLSSSKKLLDARTLRNHGTLIWTGAGDIALANGALVDNHGTFVVATSRRLRDLGGLPSTILNRGVLQKSGSTGTTVFDVALDSSGEVQLSSGQLTVPTYRQSSTGWLEITIGGTSPVTGYARLNVRGNVTLDGTLAVATASGFIPTTNDQFAVISHGSRTGVFAAVTGEFGGLPYRSGVQPDRRHGALVGIRPAPKGDTP